MAKALGYVRAQLKSRVTWMFCWQSGRRVVWCRDVVYLHVLAGDLREIQRGLLHIECHASAELVMSAGLRQSASASPIQLPPLINQTPSTSAVTPSHHACHLAIGSCHLADPPHSIILVFAPGSEEQRWYTTPCPYLLAIKLIFFAGSESVPAGR